ncbi:hypothetical protein, partial [Archaeoglobus sp.]
MLSKLGEEGRKRAMWILKRVGLCDEDGVEPKFESNELSEEELEIFDEVESAIMFNYEIGYNIALRAINRLVNLKRFRSALYVCDMIADLLPALKCGGSRREFPTSLPHGSFTGSVGVIGHGQSTLRTK